LATITVQDRGSDGELAENVDQHRIAIVEAAPVAAVELYRAANLAKEASAEAVNAVAYATKFHSEWFWRGASV
jgi:hypothetical protein